MMTAILLTLTLAAAPLDFDALAYAREMQFLAARLEEAELQVAGMRERLEAMRSAEDRMFEHLHRVDRIWERVPARQRFEACASGPSVPAYQPWCREVDFDRDGDVDMDDFGALQRGDK